MKERIVISTNEVLILFEETKIATQNKKKKIDKSCERSRKNVVIEFIMILEEIENENDDEKELEL